MQRLVRRVVTLTRFHEQPNLSYNSHRTVFHTRAPCHGAEPSQLGHHISFSDIIHSWRSNHTLSSKVRACLSQPMIVRQFALTSRNSLPRIFSKSLPNRWPVLPIVHFDRQSFNFNQSYGSYRRSWRSWFHGLTPNDMVLGLIIANVAVFLLWRIKDEKFMLNNFTISLDSIQSGRLHTLITNAFSHVDTEHIISNMIGLYFFGVNIGRNFGPEFLLKLYLAGAVGGSVFYLVHQAYKAQTSKGWSFINPSKEVALAQWIELLCFRSSGLLLTLILGASGAVNAITLLNIFLFPKATLYLDFIIPVPAVLLGIFLIGKDMLRIMEGDSKISGSAHLGGAAVAAIAWAGLRKGRF